MKIEDIKQWSVTNGNATPVNPHCPDITFSTSIVEKSKLFEAFEGEAKQHTYATSAMDGIYDAEMFDSPVWQMRNANFNDTYHQGKYWLPMPIGPYDTFEQSKAYHEDNGFYTRQYLPLKPVTQSPPDCFVNCGYADEKDCDKKPASKQPEVKQQGGEWISVENAIKPKDGQWVHCAAMMGNGEYDILLPAYSYSSKYDTYTGYGEAQYDGRVTHWMPLPSPPKSI